MGCCKHFVRYPFIFLTILTVAGLIVADRYGIFSHHSDSLRATWCNRHDLSIIGTVADLPSAKNGRISFTINTRSINHEPAETSLRVISRIEPEIAPGDILRLTGFCAMPPAATNPGCFDYAAYLYRLDIFGLFYPHEIERIGRSRLSWLWRISLGIRQDIINVINRYIPADEAAILTPMIIGDTSGLSDDTRRDFMHAGVTHVLVVSGMNVAYVTALFLFFIRLSTGLRQRYAAPFVIPFIILYVLMTGANAPVLRAGVMALFVIISLSLAREPLIYQSLALAAMTIFAFNPQSLFTASFQLSFAATIGIVYLYPRLYSLCAAWPLILRRCIGSVICVSIAAQLAVAPLLAYYFNTFSLIGLAANLIVVPLAGIITASGLLMYLAHFISSGAAAMVAIPTTMLLHATSLIVTLCASLPHATIPVATPSLLCICVYYIILWLAFFTAIPGRLRWPGTVACMLVLGFICRTAYVPDRGLHITVLDIGDADAIHVRFPNGKNWLIDAGRPLENGFDTGERIIVPYLRSRGIRKLDKAIITHPHYPHYAAMKTVLENFSAGEVLTNADVSEEPEYRELFEMLHERHIPWREVWAGESFSEGGATVKVLAPATVGAVADDHCLVLMLTNGQERILLSSDMSATEEQRLLNAGQVPTATVLQLPNHGNRHLSPAFLQQVKPNKQFISGRKKGALDILSTHDSGALEFHFPSTPKQ